LQVNMARAYQVRSFDSLLKSRMKNAQMRERIYKNLLTRLVQDERVVTTLAKCKDLSRVAERMIDLAKQNDEATVYTWINKKELLPKVFKDILPRYEHITEKYTAVYRLPPRKFDSAEMGVIEFTQNNLPKLVSEEQKRDNKEDTSISSKWKKERIPLRGTPV
ncbi:50S ribosomal protein L17-like, partial [Xenia sp. Carnegie-2017]|uniref:50S ribosomal protein L17-like n=1 Tax=Xenia sp. Carnegie-2017 TaxID=2897299 RepID=UPI001F032FE4